MKIFSMKWDESTRYKVKTVFLFTVIGVLLSLYQSNLYRIFDQFILPLLDIDDNSFNYITTWTVSVCISGYIVYKSLKGFKWSFFHKTVHCFVIFAYFYIRLQSITNQTYEFIPQNDKLGYFDIIYLVVLISLFSYQIARVINFLIDSSIKLYDWILIATKQKEKILPENPSKKEYFTPFIDQPLTNPDDDKLGYAEFAAEIANRINGISKPNPYSIGIIGEWGVGKSTVINFIKYYLDESKYIIIRFNPRHSFNPARIQEDFFSFLATKLKKYNSIFSRLFVDYMKGTGIIGKNNTIQVLLNLYNVWNKDGESERIEEAMTSLNKRVVVIIEDLDRLLAEEIIEVLKIIDNNAISKNIIFISAYDKEHINKIIGEKYQHENSMFSDKFFNWEVNIPFVNHNEIINILKSMFLESFNDYRLENTSILDTKSIPTITEGNSDIAKKLFINNIELIRPYIKTVRDVNRFLNIYILLVYRKNGKVILDDLLLLTLINYKYPSEHLNIYNLKGIKTNILKNINQYVLQNNIPEDSKPKSSDILERLFNEDRKIEKDSCNNKKYFLNYFLYYPEKIDIDNLRNLVESKIEDSNKQLLDWRDNGKIYEILEYFNEIQILQFHSIQSIFNFIDILLFIFIECNLDIRLYIRPFFLKADLNDVCKKYDIQIHEFKTEFTLKLKGQPGKYPYSLIRELIINTIDDGEENYLLSKAELQEIAKYHVENYIRNKQSIQQDLEIELLYENIDNLEMPDRTIILNKDVCAQIKDYIIENPDFYIKQFVRNGMSSSSKEWFMLACEPFWENVFGSKEEFETFINQQKLDALTNIQLARNFWKIYSLHNYKPIQFENEGITYEEAIADNLQSIAKDALKFEEYEARVEKIYNEEISNEDKINKLKEITAKIDLIKLYIRKRGEVAETIRRYIAELSTPQEAPEIKDGEE